MLTIENLMAALPHDEGEKFTDVRVFPGVPGWSAARYFAARWTEWPSDVLAKQPTGDEYLREQLAGWENLAIARVDVTEDPSLALPFVPGTDDKHDGICLECNGEAEHVCSCGDEHDCRECDGSGYRNLVRGIADKLGQSVWRSADGVEVAVQARAAELLRGYRVVRHGLPPKSPLLGLNEAGEVIVAIMPLNEITRPAPAPSESTP
jgi:hypothetical protein